MRRSHLDLGVLFLLVLGGCGSPPRGAAHAQKLLERGDYEAAERAADRGLERDPDNRALWHIKIRAPMERGDSARGVDGYLKWHHLRHRYDDAAMRQMATAVVRRGLVASEPRIRRQAVDTFAHLRLQPLAGRVAGLLDDPDPAVAAAAAIALLPDHRHAYQRAIESLSSPDDGVRAMVVSGLARRLKRVEPIRRALDDPSPRVRRAAASGLGRLHEGAERLRAIARTDPDGTVRAAALSALMRQRSAATLEVARSALTDGYVGARLAAIALIADNRETESLVAMAASADAYVALRAAVALRKAGGTSSSAPVEAALKSRLWGVRVAGLNALTGVVPVEEARRLAAPLLEDPRVEVALAAARVMARVGGAARAAMLCYQVLEGPREDLRLVAVSQLLSLSDPRGITGLAELGRSRDPTTRVAVARIYRTTDNVTLPLVGMLADPDPAVRLAAAESMLGLL